jgi:hypothetical protein
MFCSNVEKFSSGKFMANQSALMSEKRKDFFFEKKKQKTFDL